MSKRTNANIQLIMILSVLGMAGSAFSESLWPLQVGQKFVYSRSDPSGKEWIVRLEIGGGMTAKSLNYFHVQEWNYDNDSLLQDRGYFRTTEQEVYSYNPDGEDYLEFQKAPIGTKWSYYYPEDDSGLNYQVNEIVDINEVTVPYGRFSEAYKTINYKCVDPNDLSKGKSPDWYEWIMPGVGFVKDEDYWVDGTAPLIQELVRINAVAKKCSVSAGSKDNSDTISFSDTMNATADDLSAASSIEVAIDSNDMASPCVLTFPINGETFKNGKYSYSGTEDGVKESFKYDVKTGKFSFTAKNVDLAGLGCPLTIEIEIGDYICTAEVDETIVNGTKPIPINLMMGVKDALRVDTLQVNRGTKTISVKGAIAVEDAVVNTVNMVSEDLVVTLGTQTFTIPANKLKAGEGKFTCSKAEVTGGGLAAANFDFNKCSFTLTIKNVDITSSGDANFGIEFADFSESVPVVLP